MIQSPKIRHLFSIIATTMIITTSCGEFEDTCRGVKVEKFEVPTVQGQIFLLTDTFNITVDTITTDIDSVYNFRKVAFGIGPATLQFVALKPTVPGFFSEAYACDPSPNNQDILMDFQIFCDKPYNDTLPAGEDLRRVFDYNTYGLERRQGAFLQPIRDEDSTIVRVNPSFNVAWTYLQVGEYIIVTPTFPPSTNVSRKFKLVLTTKKRKFEQTYRALRLIN